MRLYSIAKTVIERHIKIRGEANPYDPEYTEYFERRRCFAWRTRLRQGYGGAGFTLRKGWSSPSRRSIRKLKMLKLNQTIAGMSLTGTSLERPEPCEGKLSRTVLRGAWAG